MREPGSFHGLVAGSPPMRSVFERLRRAAMVDSTVLVRGESGTGKELAARALHAAGPRASRPFRAVNCATFTPELLASELFGHVKGAFTGAVRDKVGLLTQADGGTLFLDEVADLSLDLQARLLRVLQERRFVPVGGVREEEVDVRLVSATNASLRELVAARRFREDLMYRLRVVMVVLPPLRDRPGDLEALTWHFIDQFNATMPRRLKGIASDAWEAMVRYPWPGNVRELRNNLESAYVLGDGPVLGLDDLAPELRGEGPEVVGLSPPARPPLEAAPVAPVASGVTLHELERRRLVDAWEATGGRRNEMSRRLGLSRSTLYRKLKAHGLC
jgi:two-component system response regulator AtoC